MRVLVRERTWWLVLLTILPACGQAEHGHSAAPAATTPTSVPDMPETALFHDGQRLLARQFRFDGTAPLFFGIYDSEKQVDCEFGVAADGALRCMPGGSLYRGREAPSTWVSGQAGPGNTNPSRMQPLVVESEDGGRFPNRDTLVDTQTGQNCEGGYTIDRDGSGSATLCDVTVDIVARGSGRLALSTLVFEGHDVKPLLLGTAGGFDAASYFDNERGQACNPIWTQQAGVRCIPQDTPTLSVPAAEFADADCKTPVAGPGGSGLAAELAPSAIGELPLVSTVRQVGALLSADRFFLQAGACVHGLSNQDGFEVGAALPWDELALISTSPAQASQRPARP